MEQKTTCPKCGRPMAPHDSQDSVLCPACEAASAHTGNGGDVSLDILSAYPFPVALTYRKYLDSLTEASPLDRLFAVKDCFEFILRYVSVVSLAARHASDLHDEKQNRDLVADMIKPALGTWNRLVKSLSSQLVQANISEFAAVRDWLRSDKKEVERILDEFVTFRNDAIGHGASRSREEYRELADEWGEKMTRVVAKAGFLKEWTLLRGTSGEAERWMGLAIEHQTGIVLGPSLEDKFAVQLPSGTRWPLHPYVTLLPCPKEAVQQFFIYDSQKHFDPRRKVVVALEYTGGHKTETETVVPDLEHLWSTALLIAAFRDYRKEVEEIEKDLWDFSKTYEGLSDFVGREFVDEEIERFMKEHDRGFVLITGMPGTGKSAIAANYLTKHDLTLSFFYRRDSGLSADTMIHHCVHALLRKYNIEDAKPSTDREQLRIMLIGLLRRISQDLHGDREVMVIDALDESGTDLDTQTGAVDILPKDLPQGVYFIVTSRPGDHLGSLRSSPDTYVLDLDAHAADNRADCRRYVESRLPDIAHDAAKLEKMMEISDGNFLVLRMLAEAAKERDFDLESFALAGTRGGRLEQIYASLWARIQNQAGKEVVKLNALTDIATVLSIAVQPMTDSQLFGPLNIEVGTGNWVIRQMIQFLQVFKCGRPGDETVAYHIYHSTFKEFIRRVCTANLKSQSLMDRIANKLDREDLEARPAAVALLVHQEDSDRLKATTKKRATISALACSRTIATFLATPCDQDIDLLMDFVQYCDRRGWWPRKMLTLTQIEEVLQANPKLSSDPERLATLALESGISAYNDGRYDDARKSLFMARDKFKTLDMVPELAKTALWLGQTFHMEDKYPEANRYYDQCLELNKDPEDLALTSDALDGKGNILYLRGDSEAALVFHKQSLEAAEKVNDPRTIAAAYESIGYVHAGLDHYPEAESYYRRALDIQVRRGDIQAAAYLTTCLADVALYTDQLEKSERLYSEGLQTLTEINSPTGIGDAFYGLGHVYFKKGLWSKAVDYHEKALKVSDDLGDPLSHSFLWSAIGNCYIYMGRLAEAKELFEKGLDYDQEDKGCQAADHADLAGYYWAAGNLIECEKHGTEALSLARESDSTENAIRAELMLARCALIRGITDVAQKHSDSAAAMGRKIGTPSYVLMAEELRSQIAAQVRVDEDLTRGLEKMIAHEAELGMPQLCASSCFVLGEICYRAGDYAAAENHAGKAAKQFQSLGSEYLSANATTLAAVSHGKVGSLERIADAANAIRILDDTGASGLAAVARARLGLLYLKQGSRSEGELLAKQALDWMESQQVRDALYHEIKAALPKS